MPKTAKVGSTAIDLAKVLPLAMYHHRQTIDRLPLFPYPFPPLKTGFVPHKRLVPRCEPLRLSAVGQRPEAFGQANEVEDDERRPWSRKPARCVAKRVLHPRPPALTAAALCVVPPQRQTGRGEFMEWEIRTLHLRPPAMAAAALAPSASNAAIPPCRIFTPRLHYTALRPVTMGGKLQHQSKRPKKTTTKTRTCV
ncbi:hypothetical protein GALMADRAFT_148570 [Galerina marginata CBS 339.88]|uniref:Uncharacterized protein n=1 Tax=Galerina marginata (strain CBS 339.88) TaxID=685588 RepID=A0A067SCV9_GALM3|nr:hypothetical protein GALMADRAFT_148570 [Galerina marginata CBS 339.88]